MDNIVVEAVGLTKVFKDFWNRPKARAVNGIDFTIKQGQVFGLLGPNGSGKSTTVKMILGLLYPTRGVLKVFGEEPRNVDMKSRIGYLPEETYLYRYLTAMETLDFFGALFGLSEEMRRERGEQLLNMVGLAHAFNRPVGEFSKGMARRIGLAQALVNDPDLVILDEPTSGLDPIGCREVKDVIRLLASRGKTVILCSHLLADVQDVCDEVVVLYGGKVRAEGPLKSILSEEDKTRIVCPTLGDSEVAELREWLAAKGVKSDAEIKIDHPVRNLEDFFLEVVRQAREQSVDTAGAQAGGEIPDYLADKGTAVLNALRRSEVAQKAMADEEPEKPAAPVIDVSKLEKLDGSAPAAPAAKVED
ncbi:MAG: ABC transporter ATP-binding protein, partial [Lentisphaerae bacterium]|nr:ABC transporter ATP-binding protein [Lentisphaerota bacterium]